jgi:hypothetical protein
MSGKEWVHGWEVGVALHKELCANGYHLENTGGGCTAYCKPHPEIENAYFLVTIAWRNDDNEEWQTDADHPTEWPVFLGFYSGQEYDEMHSSIVKDLQELFIAEQVLEDTYYNSL